MLLKSEQKQLISSRCKKYNLMLTRLKKLRWHQISKNGMDYIVGETEIRPEIAVRCSGNSLSYAINDYAKKEKIVGIRAHQFKYNIVYLTTSSFNLLLDSLGVEKKIKPNVALISNDLRQRFLGPERTKKRKTTAPLINPVEKESRRETSQQIDFTKVNGREMAENETTNNEVMPEQSFDWLGLVNECLTDGFEQPTDHLIDNTNDVIQNSLLSPLPLWKQYKEMQFNQSNDKSLEQEDDFELKP